MEFDESTPLIKFGKVSPQIQLVGSEPLNKDDGKVDIVDKELLDRSRWKILFAGFITMVLCLLTVRFSFIESTPPLRLATLGPTDLSDYKFKHWQSFNCITKTVDTVKETVRTEYTWNWKRIQRISSSAEQKSTHSYEGSEKIKESTEILARLETLLEEELIVGITYSSMTEITEEVELNCGKNEFGLMKDMIRISFMDDVVNLVLGEIIYSQETLSNVYFINTLNNEHYDESFYELAKNKVILSRANISGFQVLEYDDYYSKIMSDVIYNYARIEPNKIHDNMLSTNPNAATSLYAKIGPKFRAPLVPVSGWIPLYTYSVWTGHGEDHYYSVDGNDESQILCYIAKDISAGPNLVPLVEFYDTSKIYKDHNYGLCLSCGTGTMIGVLGYVYPLD